MMNRVARFNIYFLYGAAVIGLTACQTAAQKKRAEEKANEPYTLLRMHVETRGEIPGRSQTVPILRTQPFLVRVEKDPFISEADVKHAALVDDPGGFSIRVEFDSRAKLLLEQFTTANLGRRFAVFVQFTSLTNNQITEARWLGAPKINQRITDG